MLNFKKGGLFSRNTKMDFLDQPPEQTAQVLAVWGSPGSGKTTVAVKLAKHLADRKKNVVLVLCDMTAPMLPCICPVSDLEGDHSLCSILATTQITDSLIKHNCNTHKRISYLTLIGVRKGENAYSCPDFSPALATEFVDRLRDIAPYIIIDCGSQIAYDVLSAVALMTSDAVLRLVNCDLKSISYLSSQLPLLKDNKWDADKQYKVASNVKLQEASEHLAQVLGSVTFQIPHSPELAAQVLSGNLLADLALKDSRGFRKEIEKIAKEVFG